MKMRILYPSNPLNDKEADEPYQEEFLEAKKAGLACSLFDFDALSFNEFRPKPRIEQDEKVLYRGWMLNIELYERLCCFISKKGGVPITNPETYEKCHHLPGWYDKCSKFTPETHIFEYGEGMIEEINKLGWESYFVKDFVKSNSNEVGSIAKNGEEAYEIAKLIEKYRGNIEGGVAIRRVENFIPETEQRYFVVNEVPYSPTDDMPKIVEEISNIIDAPFYTIDTIRREDGEYRLVEVGDGQVSEKKLWPMSNFVGVLAKNA